MKKKVIIAFIVVSLMSLSVGVYAGGKLTKVTAYLNGGLAIKVNGDTFQPVDQKGNRLYPITYNNTTYLPLRAVGNALGAEIGYDGSGDGTVTISSGSDSGSSNTSSSNSDTQNTSSNTTATGSISSPIPMNQKFTWSGTYSYDKESYSGTYSMTVKSAKTITPDDIAKMGFKKPDSDSDYMLVDVLWEVKDAKLISTADSSQTMYLSSFSPDFWGSITTDDTQYIIGGTDFGFDGSMSDKIYSATNSKQLKVGEKGSYSAEGKLILPVVKGKACYMVVKNSFEQDYDKSLLNFKLN
ncbi:MAG: stalk domain-containing protein [Bacillota bacterium]|nr:stalk domain-containing protein [Bacillota bacterium]